MADQVAFKTILKYGATAVGNLVSVDAPGLKIDFKETTNHGLSDPWRTRRPTLGDAQEVTAKVQMTTAGVAALYALIDPASAALTWTVTWPFNTPIVATFSGWLSEYHPEAAEVDGILEATLKITVTGKVTIA